MSPAVADVLRPDSALCVKWKLAPLAAASASVGVLTLMASMLPGAARAEAAAAEPAYVHTLVKGDTLIGLGRRYLAEPKAWPDLAQANYIKRPKSLPVGKTLRIPLRLMNQEAVPALVTAVSGDARSLRQGVEAPLLVGQAVAPGTELRTGQGNLTVKLVDGTVLRLRASSRLQLDESHRLPAVGTVRSGVQLQQGQIEVQAQPASAGQPGFRVGTPQGVLGVRGTEFRVSADAQAVNTRSEVLEGRVAASGSSSSPGQLVNAGFGVVVDSTGQVAPPVALLAAPDTTQWAQLQERPMVRFPLPAMAGAQSFRAQVARDAAFDQVLLDTSSAPGELRLAELPDGDYIVRVRAVDGQGLQGRNAEHRFRLKARPEPPLPQSPAPRTQLQGTGVQLAWAVNLDAKTYRLQVARSDDFVQPLFDFRGLTSNSHALEGLAPGSYFWRLASERHAADQGPFGPAIAFDLQPVPPPPPPPRPAGQPAAGISEQGVLLTWSGEAGQRFDLQVARDEAFAELVLQRQTDRPTIRLELDGGGRFFVRVRAIERDGFVGPYSATQRFDLPGCLRDSAGACVRSDNTSVRITP